MPPPPLASDEPLRLAALDETRLLDTAPEAAFDDAATLASLICAAPMAIVNLIDERRQWFKARVGVGASELPRDMAVCGYTILQRGLFEVPDALADARFADNPLVTGPPHLRFYAGVPLVTTDGYAVGTLCVMDRVPRRLEPAQREALLALARSVCASLAMRRDASALAAANERLADLLAHSSDLVTQRRAAQEESGRLVAILDATPDLVAVGDPTAQHLYYLNAAGRRMLELGPDEPFDWLRLTDALPPDQADNAMREVIPTVLRDGVWVGEAEVRGRSGRSRPVSLVVLAHHGADGTIDSLSAVARDISDQKEIERIKNEFIATVSHELRTPLTSIRGSLGLLEGGVVGALSVEAREMVAIARSNADRLVRLINDILDLEKMEAGKLDLRRSDLEAGAVVAAALEATRGMAEEAGIALVSSRTPGAPGRLVLSADADRIVQVLANLVSNAIKFSPRGSGVEVRVVAAGAHVRFEVRDEGPGIGDDEAAKLFHKFQQLDSSDTRSKGGSGLGLAISKAIVEQHGGRIGVERRADFGSVFWFEVPGARSATLLAPTDLPGAG